jgi:hypothetical protein
MPTSTTALLGPATLLLWLEHQVLWDLYTLHSVDLVAPVARAGALLLGCRQHWCLLHYHLPALQRSLLLHHPSVVAT